MVLLDPGNPELRQVVDEVLECGGYAVHQDAGLLLVSDVFVVQGIANGLPPLPEGPQLVRADGRVVYAFRVPRRWAA